MLVRFTVSNFLTFREETVLSMAAGKSPCHRNHLTGFRNFSILRSACILGTGNSGKSDLISALTIGRSVILNGLHNSLSDNEPFRHICSGGPALIRYDFTSGDKLYSYDFTFDSAGFTEEGLCTIGSDGSEVLFLRVWDPEHNRYETGGILKEKLDGTGCSDESWRRRLILTAHKGQYPEFNDVLEFFRHLIVITSGTVYSHDFAYNTAVISPVLAPAGRDTVFMIDGLDHGLPAGPVRKFLKQFFESGSSRSQLIFTADNPELMDKKLLRKDEIWFTERDHHGVPHLYSLTGLHSPCYDLTDTAEYPV